jgi:hypothetical protein
MTEARDPLQPGFVRMIHPATGNIADMGEGATGLYYAAGWVDLTEENMPAAPEPEVPAPMSEEAARDTREGAVNAEDPGAVEPGPDDQAPAEEPPARTGGRRRTAAQPTEE